MKGRPSLERVKKYTLTRDDLAKSVYKKTRFSQFESSNLVNSLIRKIENAVISGETVKLAGFGKFVVRSKAARPGRNPKTGESVTIAPKRVMVFIPSAKLNARVNSEGVGSEVNYDYENV